MTFLFIYINLIRVVVVVVVATIIQLFKHDYKKLAPAAITIVLTFIPWLLEFINVQVNTLTGFLFPTVAFMAIYLGSGYRYYDLYPWWDRSIHFLSGILFFSFGISLSEKAPNLPLAGTLIFSFALSLVLAPDLGGLRIPC